MLINGVELVVNMFDADFADKYEKAFLDMKQGEQGIPKDTNLGDIIRQQCALAAKLFDDLFGAGTAKAIIRGRSDLREHLDAIELLLEDVSTQAQQANTRLSKYSPNRAARRKAK